MTEVKREEYSYRKESVQCIAEEVNVKAIVLPTREELKMSDEVTLIMLEMMGKLATLQRQFRDTPQSKVTGLTSTLEFPDGFNTLDLASKKRLIVIFRQLGFQVNCTQYIRRPSKDGRSGLYEEVSFDREYPQEDTYRTIKILFP